MSALKPFKQHGPYIHLVFSFGGAKMDINYRMASYLILGCHRDGFGVQAKNMKYESSTPITHSFISGNFANRFMKL
jgi:hypothetical protein